MLEICWDSLRFRRLSVSVGVCVRLFGCCARIRGAFVRRGMIAMILDDWVCVAIVSRLWPAFVHLCAFAVFCVLLKYVGGVYMFEMSCCCVASCAIVEQYWDVWVVWDVTVWYRCLLILLSLLRFVEIVAICWDFADPVQRLGFGICETAWDFWDVWDCAILRCLRLLEIFASCFDAVFEIIWDYERF